MVNIQCVSYRYNEISEQGLDKINSRINKGECVLLCGESGCGKTTVTRLINGLIPHFYEGKYSGQVMVDGKNTSEASPDDLSCVVGSVFQNPRSQFFNLDTTGEIAFGCENIGLPPDEIQVRVRSTVQTLDIERLLDKDIFALSGGEKQLVAIASVYALSPDIFVLDEPSSNLDAAASRELANLLQKLKNEGKTILIAEHRLYYLAGLYDRVIYMAKGSIVHDWTRDEFESLTESRRAELGLRALRLNGLRPTAEIPKLANPVLAVSDISAAYKRGKRVLDGISFSAAHGEVIGIIGRNGQGKSTFARVLCGLHKESAGSITLDGIKLPCTKRAGTFYLVMQESGYQLFSDSVENEFKLSGNKKNKPSNEAVQEIMEQLSLTQYKDRHPMSLSGGQKQRAAIGVAMAQQARTIIFDEPTSGLDYGNMRRVCKIVEMLRQRGKILFIITHDYELLLAACTRVLIIDSGKIDADFPLDEQHLHRVKEFFEK